MAMATTPTSILPDARTRRLPRRRAGGLGLVFLTGAAGLTLGAGLFFLMAVLSGDQQYMYVSLALALPAAILAIEYRSGDSDVFAPINFVLLSFLIGVSARTSYIVFSDSQAVDTMLLLGKSNDTLAPALLLITLGLAFLVAGYYLRLPIVPVQRLPAFGAQHWNASRVWTVIFLFTLVAVVCTWMFLQKQGLTVALTEKLSAKRGFEVQGSSYRAALGYYRWGASLVSLAFLIALAWVVRNRKSLVSGWGAAVVLLGLLTTIFPILVSSRTQLLSVAVYALLILHYARRRIALRTLATGLVAILALFAFLGALRSSRITVEDLATQVVSPEVVAGIMENRSFLGITKTAHIIEAVPEQFDYQAGSTFVMWLLAPIPREIWADKPPIRIGGTVAERVFGFQDINIGVPPGIIAEVYLNFGPIMVPMAMFLFGLLLRSLYDSFVPHMREKSGLLLLYIYLIFPLAFTLPGGDFSGVVIQIIRDSLPVFLAVVFIADRPKFKASLS